MLKQFLARYKTLDLYYIYSDDSSKQSKARLVDETLVYMFNQLTPEDKLFVILELDLDNMSTGFIANHLIATAMNDYKVNSELIRFSILGELKMSIKTILCNLLNCTTREIKPVDNTLPTDNVLHKKVAIVVGHNKIKQGAENYLGETEYSFNSRIANKLVDKLDSAIILFRDSTKDYFNQCEAVANNCVLYNVDVAICLHFNVYNTKVQGCEALILDTSNKLDNKLAISITDSLNKVYGFRKRGDNGVKTITDIHRGSGMLMSLNNKNITATLIEPMFADNKESSVIFEDEDKYVATLANAIKNVIH